MKLINNYVANYPDFTTYSIHYILRLRLYVGAYIILSWLFIFLRNYIELTCEWCHIESIVRELQTTIVDFNDDESPIKKMRISH